MSEAENNYKTESDVDYVRTIEELKDNKSRKISLFNIIITPEKNDNFIKAFPEACKAEELTIAHTSIGDAELVKLLKTMEEKSLMPKMSSLNLWINSVSDEVVPYFCKLIEKSKELKSITLVESSLTDASVLKIADAIAKNRGIEKVNLSCNKMTDVGANPFLQMLRDSSYRLSDVSFRDNNISNETKSKLDLAMRKKPLMLKRKDNIDQKNESNIDKVSKRKDCDSMANVTKSQIRKSLYIVNEASR